MYRKYDLNIVSRVGNGFISGKDPNADEVYYSIFDMDITEEEYNCLMSVAEKWEEYTRE